MVQARRRKEKEEEKENKSRFGTLIFVSMETISMEFWYGLLVWNFSMEFMYRNYKYGNFSFDVWKVWKSLLV